MSDSSSTSSGIGVTGILLVAFILAKIFEVDPVTHWSWWWVMSPMWIPLGVVGAIFLIGFVIAGIVSFIESR